MCFAKPNALSPLLKLVAFLVTPRYKSDYGELNNFPPFPSWMPLINNHGCKEHKSCLWDQLRVRDQFVGLVIRVRLLAKEKAVLHHERWAKKRLALKLIHSFC